MQPALGLDVRNRRQLLEKLREYDREGLGGIPVSEVKEALSKPDKAIEVRGSINGGRNHRGGGRGQ